MSPVRISFGPNSLTGNQPDPGRDHAPAWQTSGGVSRRGVMGRAIATGAGVALASRARPGELAAQVATPATGAGEATSTSASTIERESGQAVYTLPRDHRWHGGAFYETEEYWEWHYWTAFVTDVASGDEWGLFYTTMRNAFNPDTGEPVVLNYLSCTNFATGEFFPSARAAVNGGEIAGRPDGSTDPADFLYAIDSGDGLTLREQYDHADERWGFQIASAAILDQQALAMDVELALEPPGYLPTTPTGIEEEGYSPDGLYNPETMYGLSYYYYAPAMTLTGTITAGETSHEVAGSAWLEHQWGNFSTANPEAYRWRWGSIRFTEGGGINWRQWERGPDNAPVYELNHYAIHTPEGAVSYGYGRDLTYQVLNSWQSPRTGRQFGLYALLTTPIGVFYVSPIVEDQEIVIPGLAAPLWEGALEVRRDSSTGDVVGRMYMEEQFGVSTTFPPEPRPLARQLPLSGVH